MKAGKVRSQTPKLEAKVRRSPIPRGGFRRKYRKRVTLERKPGQFLPLRGGFGSRRA
ncbi:MAG: 30S ribosomal protein S30 [Candidatus Bathyarchaeia archaeon]